MTSTPEDSGEIFKRDRGGRVRVPKARREMLLDEWERSGGSAAQFADYVGIKYSTLANWIQKRRKQAGLKASLLKPGAVDSGQSRGHWVEAIRERYAKGFQRALRRLERGSLKTLFQPTQSPSFILPRSPSGSSFSPRPFFPRYYYMPFVHAIVLSMQAAHITNQASLSAY